MLDVLVEILSGEDGHKGRRLYGDDFTKTFENISFVSAVQELFDLLSGYGTVGGFADGGGCFKGEVSCCFQHAGYSRYGFHGGLKGI